MALQKTPVQVNFAQGLETKADRNQVQLGKFLALQNSVFDKQGALTKRNGYPIITTLPNTDQTTLATFNGNLLATGSNLYAFSADTNQWFNRGSIQPVHLSVQSMVRNSTTQTGPDAAVASTGLCCLAYIESGAAYYQVIDSATGAVVVSRTALPNSAAAPRVFILANYFIITFLATIAATPHLQYIALPIVNPSVPGSATDISSVVASASTGYDAFVANNNLYIAWSASSVAIRITYLTSTLSVSSPKTMTGSHTSTLMSVTADTSGATPTIWVFFWDTGSNNGYAAAYDSILVQSLAPVKVIDNITINRLTAVATGGTLQAFWEELNHYDFDSSIASNVVDKNTLTQAGVLGTGSVVLRSVGLASKAFIYNNTTYLLVAYGESNQPTYFLTDSSGNIVMRLAYSNGGGYMTTQVLPSVSLVDGYYYTPYRIKDFLATVNKGTNLASGTPVNAIYTQTGLNLVKFGINTSGQYASEIASALHLTGGQLWEYDGVKPVEHGFHVYPENVECTTATGSGSIAAGTYYYQFCYEWTDNQGNLHRSAPSIPVKQVTTTASSTNTVKVPTLRLTAKIVPNRVRIVGYRWSVAQQVYYQFTSITSPTLNDTTIDYVTITDTSADASILGQTLLYTTGGVIENIAAPASTASAMFKNRLFLINAENPNLLWYSKQVRENTPVEMSDLLTIYVAPTSGVQGSTGPSKALSTMDDKLIIFKASAAYYITGSGPTDLGTDNDFSDPVFITSAVGCDNPNSIVMTPMGLMFQSQKGIWLLARDLSTKYIGAPVEAFNGYTVQSATAVPNTNQVRFSLTNGIILMYDYYYDQWGTFSTISAISATLYENEHTYLNSYGQVLQEASGTYLDGSKPVLMSFTSAWCNVSGLQGFERFYQLFLLGTYKTPFKLAVKLAYDYNPSPTQTVMVTPDNYSAPWGGEAVWGGGGPWGGSTGSVFEARVFPKQQKCESFQVTINEIYDPSYSVPAGEGLQLSGFTLLVGGKKGVRTQKSSRSFG